MKRKSLRDFESREDFKEYLAENKFIYSGCAFCLGNGGCSEEEAAAKCKRGVLTVDCIPMGDVPNSEYPRKCVQDWFGKGCLVCPECGLIATYDTEIEDNQCPTCGKQLEKI